MNLIAAVDQNWGIGKDNDLVQKTELFYINVDVSDEKTERAEQNQAGGKNKYRRESCDSVSPEIAESVKNKIKGIVKITKIS